MILIISYPEEDHTVEVVRHLREAGKEIGILNLADFPMRNSISLNLLEMGDPVYMINGPGGQFDLSSVRVVWWRRIVSFDIDPKVCRPAERIFCESETSQAVHGALDALKCVWVNPRCADESAHRKPFQWAVARRVGMKLPRTLVTNDPNVARGFIKQVGIGRTVFKAFLAVTEEWRETRLVEAEDLARIDSVRYAPVIFQEYIEGVDIRITVVGNQLYTAEIDARQTTYPVDMRMVIGEAKIQPIELPSDVYNMILSFMREMGLIYGAIDMRRTVEGNFVFLEVNPAGQWLFVEQRTGLPITQAVADLLLALHDNQIK